MNKMFEQWNVKILFYSFCIDNEIIKFNQRLLLNEKEENWLEDTTL
jgi:hypothetical protein